MVVLTLQITGSNDGGVDKEQQGTINSIKGKKQKNNDNQKNNRANIQPV